LPIPGRAPKVVSAIARSVPDSSNFQHTVADRTQVEDGLSDDADRVDDTRAFSLLLSFRPVFHLPPQESGVPHRIATNSRVFALVEPLRLLQSAHNATVKLPCVVLPEEGGRFRGRHIRRSSRAQRATSYTRGRTSQPWIMWHKGSPVESDILADLP